MEDAYNEHEYEAFDILKRGRRAAVNGVPKDRLLADIGHDLHANLKKEIERVRFSIREQQKDFKD